MNRISPLPALFAVFSLASMAATPRDVAPGSAAMREADAAGDFVVITVINSAPVAMRRPGGTRPVYSGANYQASDAARATMQRVAADYGLTEVAAWPIQVLQVHCAVLRIPPDATREALLARLARDPRVQLAQPLNDFATSSAGYNDPYLAVQSGFRSIDAAGAQQWSRGERIRVAVIDTGIDAAHPDFGGRVVVRRNFVDSDEARFSHDRHGTAVAGIISAAANNRLGIVGVAPAVEIVALKACWQLDSAGEAARCNSLTIAQALAAALEEHAQVVNLSLTGPRDPLLNSLVAAGLARGVLFVGAAPAGGADGFPAAAPGMIAVDVADAGRPRPGVLRAPGSEVVTLVPGGHYDFLSGASLATAHVSGAIALLLAKDRRLTRSAAYQLLERSEGARGSALDTAPINACIALADLLKAAGCPEPRTAAAEPSAAGLLPTRR